MNTIAEKIKKLKFNKSQTQALSYYQSGGMINGYDNNQKEISRVLKNVQTNEVKEGNLQPGYYTRVDYKDGTKDYVTGSNEDYLMRMPNYINYMRRNSPPQINNTVAMNSYQQGGYAQEALRDKSNYDDYNPYMPNTTTRNDYYQNPLGFVDGFGMNYNEQDPTNNYNGVQNERSFYATSPSYYDLNAQSQADKDIYNNYQKNSSDNTVTLSDDALGISAKKEDKNKNLRYRNFGNLSNVLNYTGEQFGQGNTGMGIVGAGLSVLGGARQVMGGLARGRGNLMRSKEYTDNLYKDSRQYLPKQQGGKITNAEMLTGQYIADEGQGNINMERDEVVRRANSGNVQKVVGEPHIKNGKKAEGVNATLNEGDKVLSNYTKIPKEEVKEIEKKFNIKLKKDATFADAQKAFDKKLGIVELTDELAESIEKLGENETVKDATTKRLNELVLAKQIGAVKDKLDILNGAQSMIFEELFAIQETVPRLGDGTQLFDKNGKVVDEEEEIAQQGGYAQIGNSDKSNYDTELEKEILDNNIYGSEQRANDVYLTDEQVSKESNGYAYAPKRDLNSARDQWEAITGKPWSEAKRLGYTNGTAKENIKLLNELRDPRFKKENLRSVPTSNNKIIQKEITEQVKEIDSGIKKYKDYLNKLPKIKSNTSNISQERDKTIADYMGQAVEYLGNPLQTFGEYSKHGKLPSTGFSKNGRTNNYDDVIGAINPFRWASAASNSIDAINNDDYKEASREALNAAGVLSKLKYTSYLPFDKMLSAGRATPIINKAIGTGQKAIIAVNKVPLLKQQGGYIEIAKKYGISPQRARELVMQQGGEQGQELPQEQQAPQQQDQMQQIFQAIAQMMQQQMPPEEIAQNLVEMGIPQEQVGQLIQQVAEQLSQQEQAPPQEQQAMPQERQMAQQGVRYAQEAPYKFLGDDTEPQADLTGVEAVQSFTGKGYGNKMEGVDKFIDTHKWYFDSEDKKNKFKQDVVKKGGGSAVKSFQESYDTEIRSRAEKAGMSKVEVDNTLDKLGFNGKGFQKPDGLFGAFTSTRRMGNFKKTEAPTSTLPNSIVPEKNYEIYTGEDTVGNTQTQDEEQGYNNYFSTPQRMWMPIDAMRPIKKEQITLQRQDYNPVSVNLSESERIRQADIEKIMQSGLTEQQKASMMSSALASSEIAANDATGKTAQFNNQLMFATDQFNIGQRSKEDLTNAQYNQDFMNKTEASRVNNFKDWSNYYNDIYKDEMANYDRELIQQMSDTGNYYTDASGVHYRKSPQVQSFSTPKFNSLIEQLSPEKTQAYIKYLNSGIGKEEAYKKVTNT